MKARLEKDLKAMSARRDILLNEYLMSLERQTWDPATSMTAIEAAGRLHDCDRHITTLNLELKRLEMANLQAQAVAATADPMPAVEAVPAAAPAPVAEVANAS